MRWSTELTCATTVGLLDRPLMFDVPWHVSSAILHEKFVWAAAAVTVS